MNSTRTKVVSDARQRLKWLSMEKRITGLVKKLDLSNVRFVADEISKENLISSRGLFCRAVMDSQSGFPSRSPLYAAFVAIINSKFPDVGLLLVKRVVLQFKEAYDRGDKKKMRRSSIFIAHLVNQAVVYEVLALDVMLLLLGDPSSDNIRIAVSFCIGCGLKLSRSAPHKLHEIFKEFLVVGRKVGLKMNVRVSIARLFAVRRSWRFEWNPSVIDKLDLVDVGDQVTHEVSLLHDICPETSLDYFKPNSELDECEMFSRMMIGSGDCDGGEGHSRAI